MIAAPEADMTAAPTLRHPTARDGAALWRLVRESGVLDVNSSYAYLLLADRFADTSLVAEADGEIGGFVLGFIPPKTPEAIFVWQIGVGEAMRGQGLGKRLLVELVQTSACEGLTHMETNITPSNEASQALFRSFARAVSAPVKVSEGYPRGLFPDGKEEELLYRIGPFAGESRR